MRCSYCGSALHTLPNCPKTFGGQINRGQMRCSYCGSRNHNIKACPKTWGGSADRAWNEDAVEDHFVKDKYP
jgi:uncharacterized Zn-finger protein